MYRLFSLSALLVLSIGAEPRSPKIYNVLISSKKNLSPSHAVPVYEPVLRTTSLGVALPPIIYHSPFGGYQPAPIDTTDLRGQLMVDAAVPKENSQNGQGLRPLPVAEQFVPYAYDPSIVGNQQYFNPPPPQQEQPQSHQYPNTNSPPPIQQLYQKPDDPKSIIANLKRNPEIPDVPPPALPVRNS